MKERLWPLLTLLFLSPLLAELLSGSSPPGEFFKFSSLILFLLIYGLGAVLVRELKLRWNLSWGAVFLALAFGLVLEGLVAKSIFNTAWADLGVFSGYAYFFGVQWVWTINLLLYHIAFSVLIPIFITESIFPKVQKTRWLSKQAFLIVLFAYLGVVAWSFYFVQVDGQKFYPSFYQTLSTILSVFALGFLSYLTRKIRIKSKGFNLWPTLAFSFIGFLFSSFLIFVPENLIRLGLSSFVVLGIQLVFIIIMSLFLVTQILREDLGKRQKVALVGGMIFFFSVFAIFQEAFVSSQNGMGFVGVITFFALWWWGRRVLKSLQ